jgi:exopolysaccharide biosynthesis operon protein EpsL
MSVSSYSRLSVAAAMLLASIAHAQDDGDPFVFFVSDQITYDDNLFRLSDGEPLQNGEIDDRQDYINRLTAGLRARMHAGRQELLLTARLSDTRFKNNDRLDYTGGAGTLVLDWQIGSRWTGKVSADYLRTLASYSNYQFTERDVVTSYGTEVEGRWQLGPRFGLIAGGRTTRTEHSDVDREPDNFEGDSGRAGIDFVLSPGRRLAVEYRYAEGRFPDRLSALGLASGERDYEEDLLNLRIEYEITSKLQFRGNVGYLERDYAIESANPGFDGEVWRATLEWQPRTKLGLELAVWRELKAYIDAESNYFVARGASLGPRWQPLEKLHFALEYGYEKQDYIGSPALDNDPASTPVLIADSGREDEVHVARFTAGYTPREQIELKLLWNYEERSSNRPLRGHDANVVGMEIRVVF